MLPLKLRGKRAPFIKLGLAALAVIAAQCTLSSNLLAAPGDLYVTDAVAGTVTIYTQSGTAIPFASGLISPQEIVFDKATGTMAAYFYVADAGNGGPTGGVIYRYDRAGNRTTFKTGLNNPIGLAIDGSALLVSEQGGDRIQRLPVDMSAGTISLLVDHPLGIDTRAFEQSGFTTKFIATGDSVLKVDPGTSPIDIDPSDVSRSVSADPVAGNVYVTTAAGTVSKVAPDGSSISTFASGFADPHGLAFVPPGVLPGQPGFVYVADTSAGTIFKAPPGSPPTPFVAGVGNPNYIAFEVQSPADPPPTPTPSPTPTPNPSATPTPTPTPTPAGRAQNISTRVDVETGVNVAVGGFIINGSAPKQVVIRAIGPSLTAFGVAGALPNPVLELHDDSNAIIATNNDWKDNSQADQTFLTDNKLAPKNALESALVMTLDPGLYTAVVFGNNNTTGVGLVEVYDLDDSSVAGELANISTRGLVGTDNNVMIGGVIIGPEGGTDATVVVRAIGPSLTPFGVTGALANPFLQLFNGDGVLIATNDDWMNSSRKDDIIDAGLDPTDDAESAILATLIPGLYTAVVSGVNQTTGVGLVEIYHITP